MAVSFADNEVDYFDLGLMKSKMNDRRRYMEEQWRLSAICVIRHS